MTHLWIKIYDNGYILENDSKTFLETMFAKNFQVQIFQSIQNLENLGIEFRQSSALYLSCSFKYMFQLAG